MLKYKNSKMHAVIGIGPPKVDRLATLTDIVEIPPHSHVAASQLGGGVIIYVCPV